MADVTLLLDAAAAGDREAAADLLPLVYEELRRLAAARLADEPVGNTLQPTALVHEAYLRLVGTPDGAQWNHRGHFYAAAAGRSGGWKWIATAVLLLPVLVLAVTEIAGITHLLREPLPNETATPKIDPSGPIAKIEPKVDPKVGSKTPQEDKISTLTGGT
jgi:hypothetical protein